MISSMISDTFVYLSALEPSQLIRVFWFFIIFDVPRYVLSDTYIFFYTLFSRFRSAANEEFVRELIQKQPLVSVIIPVLNEQDTIKWTIRSLHEQSYKNLELIIVDDGSTDNTPLICKKLSHQKNVVYYRFKERAGKSAALNHGLRNAKGKYIIFVDSDTTFDRDAIFTMIKAFANPKVGGVAGNLRPRNSDTNIFTALQYIEYMFSISIGRRIRAHFGILPIISGAFGGFRKDIIALETIGGHEPGPGNDSDLAIKVRKQGLKIVFIGEANCLTNVPVKGTKLVKQRMRWDRNIIKNRIKKHKNVFNPFSKSFRFIDLVSFVDSIFFHVILAFITIIYLIDLSFNYPGLLAPVMLINYCLYVVAEIYELIIAVTLSKRYKDFWLVFYLPIFNPYKILLKLVRLTAYVQELFFNYSLRDPFAPYKVRKRMIRW